MSELPGQLPLFTLDGCDEETQKQYADEEEDYCSGDDCWCRPFALTDDADE